MLVGEHGRGRRLDHGAEQRLRAPSEPRTFVEHAPHGADLFDVRDHRQQDAHLARGLHAQQRAQLHLEQVGPPQAGAHAAQAERRIVLGRQR